MMLEFTQGPLQPLKCDLIGTLTFKGTEEHGVFPLNYGLHVEHSTAGYWVHVRCLQIANGVIWEYQVDRLWHPTHKGLDMRIRDTAERMCQDFDQQYHTIGPAHDHFREFSRTAQRYMLWWAARVVNVDAMFRYTGDV